GDKAIQLIINKTISDNARVRESAAICFYRMTSIRPDSQSALSSKAVSRLRELFADPDHLVRVHAIRAYWVITKDSNVYKELIKLSINDERRVRYWAIRTTTEIGVKNLEVDVALNNCLADSDPYIRLLAKDAIETLRDK